MELGECYVLPGQPGGWNGTTGSATVEDLAATTTYRLSCTGPSGDAEDSVHVAVISPPGTQIVFQANEGASADIYIANADGSGLTRLTDNADADLAPSWSGDGRQIYFLAGSRRRSCSIDVVNADGTGQRGFLSTSSQTTEPAWAGRPAYCLLVRRN